MRRDRGERLHGIALGLGLLEPHEAVAQDAAIGEVLTHLVLDRAEILPDDERARPRALERQQVEHLARRQMDVGARLRRSTRRDPEEAVQTHYVVDAQPAHAAHGCPHGLDERIEVRRAELPRDERRKSPVLPLDVEAVGRGADVSIESEQVLPHPCVRAPGVEADRQIPDQLAAARGSPSQLHVELPLQPHVQPHR